MTAKNRRGSPKINAKQIEQFFETLKLNGNATQAAKMAGFDRTSAYNLRNDDPEFEKRWSDCVAQGRERLADDCMAEAFRRGHDGVDEVVVSHGQVVTDPERGGYLRIRKYSDGLLSKLMDGLDPKTFKTNAQVNVNIIPDDLKPDPEPTPDEPAPDNIIT